jgi:hypothetical protein
LNLGNLRWSLVCQRCRTAVAPQDRTHKRHFCMVTETMRELHYCCPDPNGTIDCEIEQKMPDSLPRCLAEDEGLFWDGDEGVEKIGPCVLKQNHTASRHEGPPQIWNGHEMGPVRWGPHHVQNSAKSQKN